MLEEHFVVKNIDVSALAFAQEEEQAGDALTQELEARKFHRFTLLWCLARR